MGRVPNVTPDQAIDQLAHGLSLPEVRGLRSIRPTGIIIVAALLSLPFMVLSVLDGGALRVAWDNAQWTVSSIGAALATAWSIRGTNGRVRTVRTAGAVALGLWMVSNVVWAGLSLIGAATVPSVSDIFVVSITLPATFVLIASVHGLVTRAEEAAIYLDSVIGFLVAGTVLLFINGPGALSLSPLAGVLAITYPTALLGLGVAGLVGVLAIGYPIAPRGACALLFGSGLIGVAFLGWVAPTARGVAAQTVPSILFTVGTLIAGFGSSTWSDQRSSRARYLRNARIATRLVGPVAAGSLFLLILVPVPDSIDTLVHIAVVSGGCLVVIRQAFLLQERTTMLVRVTTLTDENEHLVVQLRAELERRAIDQRRMIQASRAAAVGELAAGVAHEVNNPLTGVLGFAEILIDSTPADDPRRADLETIRDEALRARDIVRALRDFADPRSPELVTTDLSVLIHQTIDLLRYSIERRGIVISEDLPTLPPVLVDGPAIQQALLNILTNARQALEDGGRLDVAMRIDGNDRVITVADDGVGMDSATARLAFDPFYSGRKDETDAESGAGLGLSISSGLIESHAGTISIQSTLGRGTTVEIRLPATRPPVMPGGSLGGRVA